MASEGGFEHTESNAENVYNMIIDESFHSLVESWNMASTPSGFLWRMSFSLYEQ